MEISRNFWESLSKHPIRTLLALSIVVDGFLKLIDIVNSKKVVKNN